MEIQVKDAYRFADQLQLRVDRITLVLYYRRFSGFSRMEIIIITVAHLNYLESTIYYQPLLVPRYQNLPIQ